MQRLRGKQVFVVHTAPTPIHARIIIESARTGGKRTGARTATRKTGSIPSPSFYAGTSIYRMCDHDRRKDGCKDCTQARYACELLEDVCVFINTTPSSVPHSRALVPPANHRGVETAADPTPTVQLSPTRKRVRELIDPGSEETVEKTVLRRGRAVKPPPPTRSRDSEIDGGVVIPKRPMHQD